MRNGILLLLLTVGFVSAQNRVFDNLQVQLANPTLTDSMRIEVLNVLAREYVFVSRLKSIEYASEALVLSKKTANLAGEAYAHRNLASTYYVQEQFYAGSEFIEKAMSAFEQLNDSAGIANCYITIGYANRKQHNYKKSVEYLEMATAIFRRRNSPERLGVSLYNLALSQMLDGDLVSSTSNIREVVSIFEAMKHLLVISPAYRVLGIIEFKKGNLKEAKKKFLKVLDISLLLNDQFNKEAVCESLFYLAKIAEAEKNQNDEFHYITEAIRFAKENQYADLLQDAYIHLIRIDLRNQNFKNAESKLLYFNFIQDSVTKVKDQNHSQLMEIAMNVLKTEEANKQLQIDYVLKEQVIKTQKKQIVIYVVSLVSIILLAGVFYFFSHQRKKTNRLLLQLNKIIFEKSTHLEKLNETKNRFFSIVAHDLKSPLDTLKAFIHLLQNHSPSITRDEMLEMLRELDKNVTNTINLADKLILWARTQMETVEINPTHHNIYQVISEAIKVYSNSAATKKISLIANVPTGLSAYADQNHTEFVIRNLINNAVKFTPPHGSITVNGNGDEGFTVISVSNTIDDLLFDVQHAFTFGKTRSTPGTAGEKGSGLGLILCKEFVEANKGKIEINTDHGQRIQFMVGLPAANS